MKKIIYLIGAFVTTAAIVGAVAIMLNKLKISLSIEGIDDTLDEENAKNDIDLSIENEHDSTPSGETEKSVVEFFGIKILSFIVFTEKYDKAFIVTE